jgi:hypothetical protein
MKSLRARGKHGPYGYGPGPLPSTLPHVAKEREAALGRRGRVGAVAPVELVCTVERRGPGAEHARWRPEVCKIGVSALSTHSGWAHRRPHSITLRMRASVLG